MKKFILPLISFFIASGLLHSQTVTDPHLGKENNKLSGQLIGSKKIRFFDYSNSHSDNFVGYNKQVSSSEDASIISVSHGGSPYDTHILQYNTADDDWDIIGTIGGNTFDSKLSADGTKILISSHPSRTTMGPQDISVYQFDGTTSNWNLVATVDPSITPYAISFSDDGSTIAIGDFASGTSYTGKVQIYSVDYNNNQLNLSTEFNGESTYDAFGKSLDLNNDGSIIAIGAPEAPFSSTTYGNGYVKIYKYESSSWIQLGQNLVGESSGDRFGQAVDLSFDGLTLAIGSPTNDPTSIDDDGQVEVFSFSNNNWVQLGQDLEHQGDYDNTKTTKKGNQFGTSVALSGDGTILAVSAPYNSTATNTEGYVEIFQLVTNTWVSVQITRPWDLFNRNTDDYDNGFSDFAGQYFGYTLAISKNGEKFIGSTSTSKSAGYVAAVRTGYISAPTISISASETTSGSTTNDSYLSLTFTTSAETTSFFIDDVSVSGGYLDEFSKTNSTTYSAKLYATSDGQVSVVVNDAQFTDSANAPNTQSDTFIWNYDSTAPALSAVTIASNNSNTSLAKVGDQITLSITASETIQSPTVTIGGNSATVTGSGTSWSATYTLQAGDTEGAIGFTVDFDDAAGNSGTQVTATTDSSSVSFDETTPTMTISSSEVSSGDTSNDSSISLTFTASEATSNFTASDITVSAGTLSSFTATSSTVYTATLTPSTDATYTVNVAANLFTDAVGNNNTAATPFSWTYDSTAPALSAVTIASNNSNTSLAKVGDQITLSITASETIQSPTVTIGGNSTTVTGSGTSWSATYTLQAGDTEGAIGFTVDFYDAAGNSGTQVTATTDSSSVSFDETTPTMTISSSEVSSGDTSNDSSISLTFTASEATSNFTASDITVSAGTLSSFTATSSTVYTATLTPSTDATYTVNVAANLFTDVAGNTNLAANQFSWTYDSTTPILSAVTIASNNSNTSLAKVGDQITLSITASETIQSPTVTIGGNSATVTGSGTSWSATYTLQAGDTEGAIGFTVDFDDAAGNSGTQVTATTNSSSVSFDETTPTLSAVTIASNNSNTSLAKVGDQITLSITASETIQSPTVTIGGNSATVTGSGTSWSATYTLQAGDTEGAIGFTVDFDDAAGNSGTQVTATTDSSSVSFDETTPTLSAVTIASNNSNTSLAKVGDQITLSITASETIQSPTVTIGGNSATVTGSGTSWSATYTLQAGDTEGAIGFTVDFDDAAGNSGTQVTATTNSSSVSFDETTPTMTISSSEVSSGDTSNDSSISLTFTASEATSNFTASDITVSAGTLSSFTATSSTVYTATLTPSTDATYTVNVAANLFTDAVGNNNTAATPFSWTYVANASPTGTPLSRSFTQDDADIEIDLTEGVTDPDGDELSVSDFVIEYLLGDSEGDNYAAVTDPVILAGFEKIVKTASLTGNKLQLNLSLSNFLTGLETGKIKLSYNITDGTVVIPVSTEIPIKGKNDAPAAQDEIETLTVVLNEDGTAKKDINGNDILQTIEEGIKVIAAVEGTDPDRGDTIAYELAPDTSVSEGTLTFNADGSYSFEPEEHFYGEVTFDYYVEDSFGAKQGPYKVTIVIAESPDDDGIPTTLETLGKSEDLDGDGIPDRKQNNISHFPMTSYDEFVAAKAWANGEGGTQPAQSKYGAILVGSISDKDGQFSNENYKSDPNAKLKDLGIVAISENIQESFEFKADLYQFSIIPEPGKELTDLDENPNNGLQTRIVLDLPEGIEATTYIKKDSEGNFFSFKDDQDLSTFDDGATLIDTNGDGLIDRIVVTLTDNALGDTDPEIGQFTDPGGLGQALPEIDDHTTSPLNEGQAVDTFIYDVNEKSTGTDFDLEGDELTYTIASSNAEIISSALKIDSSTGILSVKESEFFDFESFVDNQGVANMEVLVQVNDPFGNEDLATITIPLTNVDEYPRIITSTAVEFLEQQPTNIVVVDVETLPDYQDITTYTILNGKDGAAFNLDSTTGELKFNFSPVYFEKQQYVLDIQASDILGKTDSAEFTITILPLNSEDVDNDGTLDTDDAFPLDPTEDTDTDGDGTGNNADTDDDNDGTLDTDDAFPLDPTEDTDTDGDGTGNNADTDDDNDGTLDTDDAFPLDPTEDTDTDGEGTGNNADTDDDNDGTLDTDDAFPLDPTEDTDTDGDGTGNNADTDDDGDGYTDTDEIAASTDPLDATDVPTDTDADGMSDATDTDDDNDGTLDTDDAFPLDPTEDTDTDGDGTGNNADTDDDNDGTLDTDDAFPLDPTEDTDTDGDGTGNNADTDDDNDGTLDTDDAFPLDPTEDTDTDGDGTGNSADTDDDNDGVLDGTEKTDGTDGLDSCDFVLASQTVTPSTAWNAADCDSDGVSNADELTDGTDLLNPDSDGDGVLDGTEKTDGTDGLDSCDFVLASQTVTPSTAWNAADCDSDGVSNSIELAQGDTDGDGIPDYLDADDDGDGLPTAKENADRNGDGNPSDALDSNNNGVPDYLEPNAYAADQATGIDVEVYNAISPNGDGLNDVLVVRNIQRYPDNKLMIFNRRGQVLYQVIGYGQGGNFFDGRNKQGELLPAGMYFYVLKVETSSGLKQIKGEVYINY